ncbi:MAG: ergothioneine biosynthesis protein EgtB [Steroidobacteraceae bacterium]
MATVQTPLMAERPGELTASAFAHTRAMSRAICEPLEIEDFVVQSMPDASPVKWHLAHTSWFFEQFILKPHLRGYRTLDPKYEYLFNSYYQAVGPMHQRPSRGLLTRPTVKDVLRYREHVDEHMAELLIDRMDDAQIHTLTTLGINHEQQHQELILTDLKHAFSRNPLQPAYRPRRSDSAAGASGPMRFQSFDGGIREIGASGDGFCFDNELPRHRVLVEPYALGDRLVTNAEYLEFVRDGGYRRPEFWLSDGWTTVTNEAWAHPFYWDESLTIEFTLAGPQSIDPAAPVSHISFYEADAFARWAGARLPTEMEWELAAASLPVAGNLLDLTRLHPESPSDAGMTQMFGDVWEWTASPYIGYPGYRTLPGALGEYNGKFMCNQWVLRGGSCVTPASHIRASYRNFFPAQTRWQFAGLRLARHL